MLDTGDVQYEHGYRIGSVEDQKAYINNHLKLIFKYHTEDDNIYRVVGFEVQTSSIDREEYKFEKDICSFPQAAKKQEVISAGT